MAKDAASKITPMRMLAAQPFLLRPDGLGSTKP